MAEEVWPCESYLAGGTLVFSLHLAKLRSMAAAAALSPSHLAANHECTIERPHTRPSRGGAHNSCRGDGSTICSHY